MVFDGASYGQFISGTNNGHDKGWAGNHHRIGSLINQKLEQIDASITPESHESKNTMLPKREVERKVKSLVAPRAKPKTVAQKTHLTANVSEKVHAKDFTKDMNRLHSLIRWNKKQEEIEETPEEDEDD